MTVPDDLADRAQQYLHRLCEETSNRRVGSDDNRAAVISLVAIVPWWNTVPPGAKVGAAFDILLIVALALP